MADKNTGRDFEGYVARLYESLGFRVDTNVNLGGQQVDLLAETFIPGIGSARLMIECKWRERRSVSNQEIFDFITAVKALRPKNHITRGVLVSSTGFSKDAMSIGLDNREDVELLSLSDLENQLFDFRRTLQSFVDEYESSQIFASYVPLRATYQGTGQGAAPVVAHDIEATLEDWIRSSKVDYVSILADYGAGKTTLLQRLKYNMAKRCLTDNLAVKPFFVPLKKYHNHDSLEAFLKAIIVNELEREIPLVVFWRAVNEGRFVIFLDGFDEVVTEADRENRRDSFLQLLPLIGRGSKVILTCRPSYFISAEEHEELIATINGQDTPITIAFDDLARQRGDEMTKAMELKTILLSKLGGYSPLLRVSQARTRVVNLELFDEKQIDIYLRRFDRDYRSRFSASWQEVKNFLMGIYDLRDLIARPILLAMVNETVLNGGIAINSEVGSFGPSTLYEVYTSFKLDTDWLKGLTRQLIPKEHRVALAETIAVGMFERASLEISYEDLLKLSAQGSAFGDDVAKDLRGLSPAVIAADLQVCTFLTRTGEGVFRFSHRSFVEFFVARHLKKMAVLYDKKPIMIMDRYLPREVLYFWGGFAMLEPVLRERLLRWYAERSSHGAQFASNVTGALLYSKPVQEGLTLSNTEVLRIDVRKIRFKSPVWKKMKFVNVGWQDLLFSQVDLTDVTLKDSEVRGVTMEDGRADLNLLDTGVKSLTAKDLQLVIRSRSSRLETGRFINSRILVSGKLRVAKCSFHGSAIEIGSYTESIDFEGCDFHDSIIRFPVTSSAENVSMKNCTFDRCSFLGMVVTEAQYDKLVTNHCQGFLLGEGLWEGVRFDPSCPVVEDERQPELIIVKNDSWSEAAVRKQILSFCDELLGKQWARDLGEYLD